MHPFRRFSSLLAWLALVPAAACGASPAIPAAQVANVTFAGSALPIASVLSNTAAASITGANGLVTSGPEATLYFSTRADACTLLSTNQAGADSAGVLLVLRNATAGSAAADPVTVGTYTTTPKVDPYPNGLYVDVVPRDFDTACQPIHDTTTLDFVTTLTLTQIDAAHGTLAGHVEAVAAEGSYTISGAFEATSCPELDSRIYRGSLAGCRP